MENFHFFFAIVIVLSIGTTPLVHRGSRPKFLKFSITILAFNFSSGYRMILQLSKPSSFSPNFALQTPKNVSSATRITTLKNVSRCSKTRDDFKESKKSSKDIIPCSTRFCSCFTRRHLIEAFGTALFPIDPSFASNSPPNDPMDMLRKIHPSRPDWYEELYASLMETGTKAYEAEIAGYKSQLFANLRGKANKILEVGIGTGPNLKYYGNEPGIQVFGIDPNMKMQKYAQAAAEGAGLPATSFKFMQAVSEALPLGDASVDAVVGTLVLCSVKDVDLTLKEIMRVLKPDGQYLFVEHVAAEDGTIRRFVQDILDPLQQFVADGCHLTRKTEKDIAKAGFSTVELQQALLSTASIINPHVFGIAHK